MKYKRYIIEFFGLTVIMTAAFYYFNDQNILSSLALSTGASLLTVVNKYYLDKKALKKKNNPKA
ncbi:hypothetical protein EG240_12975 [Paenimyroides tangerinum]|uniref:Uncharacterized protein n=1 Tax=Paenimyroides tangerinum TaxID=2488728 RepID=A0A3P3W4Z0_9FLAO|nr:hypothetical protein [Paenimyroides tangerinum]RRJ89006.1 hypothetical protein EG240_12975 [Paenimyroides tangerinum]